MKFSSSKNKKTIILGIIIIAIIIGIFTLLKTSTENQSQGTAYESLRDINEQKINLHAQSLAVGHILPSDRVTKRRNTVTSLHNALDSSDYKKAAFLNSILAQEALQRAYTTLTAWKNVRDSKTGLVPRVYLTKENLWKPKDNASDLFPFLLIASKLLDSENEKLWLYTLAKEREICGPMPCTILYELKSIQKQDLPDIIFGASEYAKDGLLTVTERFGKGPWFERLEEIMQSIINAAYIETKSGKISSTNCEVNGEILQVLTRLYWITRNPQYLQMAETIAEAYLFEIFPNNHSLPPFIWDFKKKEPKSQEIQIRDHGSEIIPGLVELYFLEKMLGRSQALRYREEIKKMLDKLLKVGRTKDGLWYSAVENTTYKPTDVRIVDTWGYILNAYKTFDIAEGTSIYSDEIQRTMKAAASLKSHPWEGVHFDGYADSIESMLYLLPWFDIPECHLWVDDEIEIMFDIQSSTGFIDSTWLDGNFIRTALLYASYKTQGAMVFPWHKNIQLGAAYDKNNKELYIYINSESDWNGFLKFDTPRHKTFLNLPVDYPRLNSTPEWYVVYPERSYNVINMNTDQKAIHTGKSLASGLPINLNEKNSPLLLKISIITASPEKKNIQ